MKDWWGHVLCGLLSQSEHELKCLDASSEKSDSWEDLCILMAAADNLHFLQHAYDERHSGDIHVEVVFLSD